MTKKVAISLPDELLDAVDEASAAAGTSRSGFLAAAARTYLDEAAHRRDVAEYVASYRSMPETDDDVAASEAFLQRSLIDE